jgi:hypothetical protein
MAKYDRLLCHPHRVFVEEICDCLVKQNGGWQYRANQKTVIPVDPLNGNPDPYVFHYPWLYGYCRNANMRDDTGEQTIIIFGTYLKDGTHESFLVDTVFVVSKRYKWLGEVDGYLPSKAFRDEFPYTKEDKLYKDFIIHRVEHGHHPKAKAIFTAEHVDNKSYDYLLQTPHVRSDKFFSFIPLYYEDGIYKLIDILPIIKMEYPKLFADYDERRNRLYQIDFITVKVIDYLIQKANTLVVKTSGKGLPEAPDMNLQQRYYKNIYNITDVSFIERSCVEMCFSKLDLDEDEEELDN